MIRLVVALAAEARPLVRHLGLRGVGGGPFPLYRRASPDVALVVSGPGKVAAAAATAHIAPPPDPGTAGAPAVWLNIGVAGAAEAEVGRAFLAHTVEDGATGRRWYPPLAFPAPCPTAPVLTVDRPETAYPARSDPDGPGDPHSWLFEMEAAGFYPTACRFASAELVHCLKVVSDNRDEGLESFSPRRAEELVAAHLETLDALLAALRPLAAELAAAGADPPHFAELLERWRFTVTQRRRLRRLLLRLRALRPEAGLAPEILTAGDGRDALRRLERYLDALALGHPPAWPVR